MLKRRPTETFNLSFLDVMSCGFGAVVLIFLLIDHARKEEIKNTKNAQQSLLSELSVLITQSKDKLEQLQNQLQRITQRVKVTATEATQALIGLGQTQKKITANIKTTESAQQRIKELEKKIAQQKEQERVLPTVKSKPLTTKISPQQFSGLNLKGKRWLILYDRSASMLADNIIDIFIYRNQSDAAKQQTEKWQHGLRILDWLDTQLLSKTQFQIYTFNSTATVALPGTAGTWLEFGNGDLFREAAAKVKELIPEGGTSLINAFSVMQNLRPAPDNLILLTDSLPTQGSSKPAASKVTGTDRLRYFNQAVRSLPRKLPVNIILLPTEGDPKAAASYWRLAIRSEGSFFTPSEDWP